MIAHAQDLYIQVGNVKTRYWELGESGSTVLFVHGLGSFIEHWKQNLSEFSKHHRVYAIDLVGFGLTEKPTVSYSISFLAKFVQDALIENRTAAIKLGRLLHEL